MSISRRKFLTAGAIAAIAAGVSLNPGLSGLAQDALGKKGVPTSSDPLSYYTQATFTEYINSIFILRGRTTVEVTLTKVEDTLPAKVARTGGRESFALSFRGGSIRLPQDTYEVEHPALGTFALFLVPSDTDENGTQGYVAVINRLGYAGKPSGPKPVNTKRLTINPTVPESQTPAPTTEGKPNRKLSETPEEKEIRRPRRSPID